jgi:hypothetical protein
MMRVDVKTGKNVCLDEVGCKIKGGCKNVCWIVPLKFDSCEAINMLWKRKGPM